MKDGHVNWLTDNKIPVGDMAEAGFEWLEKTGRVFFDGLAEPYSSP